jgi:hypothetical protein
MASPFKKQLAPLLANSPAFQKRDRPAISGIKIASSIPSRGGDAPETKGS